MYADDIRAQKVQMRLSTKIGLIRIMRAKGIMSTSQAIRAIFA